MVICFKSIFTHLISWSLLVIYPWQRCHLQIFKTAKQLIAACDQQGQLIGFGVWEQSRKPLKSESFWLNGLAAVPVCVPGCYFSKWQLSGQRSQLMTGEGCALYIQSDCCAQPESQLANWCPSWSNTDCHTIWLSQILNCVFNPLNLLLDDVQSPFIAFALGQTPFIFGYFDKSVRHCPRLC